MAFEIRRGVGWRHRDQLPAAVTHERLRNPIVPLRTDALGVARESHRGVYPVQAWFDRDQLLEVSGETSVYNGLEIDGVGGAVGQGVSYHFCPTCGSTVYAIFDTVPESTGFSEVMGRAVVVPVGNFVDPEFPPPQRHNNPELQPNWLVPYSD